MKYQVCEEGIGVVEFFISRDVCVVKADLISFQIASSRMDIASLGDQGNWGPYFLSSVLL